MAQTNLIGKNILGYNVIEMLGAGAFGTVYRVVKSNAAGEYVRALKHITIPNEKQYYSVLNSMGGDVSKADKYFSIMLQNIVSEINILNNLSGDKHIVRYYENDIITTESPKQYDIYILMEYVTPLEDYINHTNFTVRDVVNLGLNVLYGLQVCHDNGIIHRDIKDDNIFVSEKGEYKIGDFGVSKILKGSSKAESLKGTPNFLAPEVYLGIEGYSKSVDLYALGVVLYRLLNYSRNPFLPQFPNQYSPQDEDKAFEKRMSGKIPEPPFLGGKEIGKVIIKAISNCHDRYQTADEFISALANAARNTPDNELDANIKFINIDQINIPTETNPIQYGATIAETIPGTELKDTADADDSIDKQNNSINKHLFDTISEMPPTEAVSESKDNPPPDTDTHEPETQEPETHEAEKAAENTEPETHETVMASAPLYKPETPEPQISHRKGIGNFIFAVPAIIFLAGLLFFYAIIPHLDIFYGIRSLRAWLFSSIEGFMWSRINYYNWDTCFYTVFAIKVLAWLWVIALCVSLFLVGKKLHSKPEPDGEGAILKKKEPFLMIQDINNTLKQIKLQTENYELDPLLNSVRKLEEKLSVESDFGYGNDAVIKCENDIAKQLQYLTDSASRVAKGNVADNIKALTLSIENINFLLRRRTELKKR